MKTILKCLAWIAVLLAISLAIVYGVWLILIFMLFGESLWMWLTIAGELFLIAAWWWIVGLAEC